MANGIITLRLVLNMENSGLLAVKSMVCAEYTVKKSQFFAYALPLYSLAEIPERLAYVRDLHKEARHHVYAWQYYDTVAKQQYSKFSDDGEPAQTAGAPLFHVLTSHGINNTLLVVSRIFGGILLGAGGLVRAYSQAGNAVLQLAETVQLVSWAEFEVIIAYAVYQQLLNYLQKQRAVIVQQDFSANVKLRFLLPFTEKEVLKSYLQELTAADFQLLYLGRKELYLENNK